MDAIAAILSRRSVRKFDDRPVEEAKIEALLEAGAAAPSACNKRPVNFYVITDKALLSELDGASHFSKMPSPLVIVVAGDLDRALPRSFSEYWIQDASAATENILVAATALGLGSCWCGLYPQVRAAEKVKELLGITGNVMPLSLIHLGYPAEEREPHSGYDRESVRFYK